MKVYLAGGGGRLKGDGDLRRLGSYAMRVYLAQGRAPNFDRLDDTMFDIVCLARVCLGEQMKIYLAQGRQPQTPNLEPGERGANHTLEWIARTVRVYLTGGGHAGQGSIQHIAEVAERLKLYLVSGGTGAPDGPSARLFALLKQERLRTELAGVLSLLFGREPSEEDLEKVVRVYFCVGHSTDGATKSMLSSFPRLQRDSCLALYRELDAGLRERYGEEPDEATLEELVKIYLCSTHSNDDAPLETQRNGSLGQLGRLGELMKLFLCTWPHGAGGDPRDISKSMKIFLSTGRAYRPGDLDDMGLNAHTRVSPFKRPIRLLLSYHYYKSNDLDALLKECFDGVPIDIFADSGAYSAASLGEKVDPQDYIRWVEKWQHHFSAVSAPDVIGDAVASTRETEVMLKAGLKVTVLPVYHVGEPWDFLHYWNDRADVDYIALGGMVPHRKDRKLLAAWLKKCFSIIRPDLRVHGFGMTSWPDLVRWPWYSVDSSSWTAGFRYARLKLFDDKRGEMDEVDMRNPKDLLQKAYLIQGYGLASRELLSQTYDRDVLCGVCVESWQRAEAWLEEHRKKSRIYLAAGSNGGGPNHVAELGPALKKGGKI